MRSYPVPWLTTIALSWLVLMLITGCGGIDPDAVRPFTGLRGTIRYVGGKNAWPKDSIYDLRVVAFERKPKVREDVVSAVVQQTAAFSPLMLPTFEDSTLYVLEVLGTPRTFEYVVVAMQNGPSFLTDWLMLDVYAPSGDPSQPGRIVVPSGATIDLNFQVDFNNLPPQPFP
ncbi:MAG: hypothetical protein FGM32_03275 [Candidatus Kapabacteria bacterium]|nr:hypothetical protein [Candidatus Kapabacteria bacterium]